MVMNDHSTNCELPKIRHANALKSVRASGALVYRDLVVVGKVPIVLFRKSQPMLSPRFDSVAWQQFSTVADLPSRLEDELEHWNQIQRFTFNCHMLSIGDLLGMSPTGWLEGSSSRLTLLSNPVADLLKHYFAMVRSDVSERQLSHVGQEDDVVVFRHLATGDIVHSARVRRDGERLFLLSKFGEDPACVTTLCKTAEKYAGEYDSVQVYRCNFNRRRVQGAAGTLRRFDHIAQTAAGGSELHRISGGVANCH